jgi:hypothetical protein
MNTVSKSEIKKSLKDLRASIRNIEILLAVDDFQTAFACAQDLVGTSCIIEELLQSRVDA